MKSLPERLLRDVLIGIGIAIALLTAGCAAATSAAGFIGSGGTTLYKSARETGPKVELVIIKFEMNRTTVATPTTK